MPTIAELKTLYTEAEAKKAAMLKGQDIFKDTWSPNDLIVEGVTEPAEKSAAYIQACQVAKDYEDQLNQAEQMRKMAGATVKDLPVDSEYDFNLGLKRLTKASNR